MRALIVADSPAGLPSAQLALVAQTADVVVAADGGAARCVDAGVTPDLVVGDLDSLARNVEEGLRATGIRFETSPADKDVSDLDLAVEHARRLGAESIVVVGVLGGRVDHELAALGTLARARDLRPRIVGEKVVASVLAPDGSGSVSITGPGVFSVLPLLGSARVSCVGARWTLTNARLEPISSLGLSNRVAEGTVAQVTVHEGVVLLCLP